MKLKLILFAVLFGLFIPELYAESAIYACGHMRRHREITIPQLKFSGYTTVILFNLNVAPDGSLTTDFNWNTQQPDEFGGIVCQDGEYVFQNYQPHYIDDVKSLLQFPTSISRIEMCIGGWGNDSYGNIRKIINKEGTGENSILYRNFKALKDAIPEIVAINNDQEQDYYENEVSQFHIMLAQLGYLTTIAPYTNKSFWESVVKKINQAVPNCVDRVYLQTYDGGASNIPKDWNVFGEIPMFVGYNCESSDNLADMEKRMLRWKASSDISGGFLWNYNNESRVINEWATAINRIFPSIVVPEDQIAAVFYQKRDMEGYSISLPVGKFTQSELAVYGATASDLLSVKLMPGYQVTIFSGPELNGLSDVFYSNSDYFGNQWFSQGVCSAIVEPIDEAHIEEFGEVDSRIEVFNMHGLKIDTQNLESLPSGIYIIKSRNKTKKIFK
ncbi:MAG: T9SS type A sorting domain-containing protein [Muribaculaceae bacterium]|nr:T9SS type A sorting domain-containing protein [Muribaculaceae bacterium]